MSLLESGENYLETILVLTQRNGSVRSIDVANEMNFTKPSVSRAMSILKREEYIHMEADGRLVLTEKGMQKATSVLERHLILTRYINEVLGVSQEIAEKDACRIEHIISPETFEGIKKQLKKA
ncbi:MAG: metal-dependent transcriptional regulator [Phascolarctobacterium sp.]|nr:metal-dependent transcriptional regulator [Phascolarctobacterium sp.]MBQ7883614.1 metal-dependent transcriptional regulator [Phascolarctobacterium sp.]